jgi:GAF domain-containing protein
VPPVALDPAGGQPVTTDLRAFPARCHRAFNERHFDVWREVFDQDVVLLVDGMPFRGVDAAVAYGVGRVRQFPGLYIAAERVVAESGDTIVTEIDLVAADAAGGGSRTTGTKCEICRVRDGHVVSVRSYFMPETPDRVDAVPVPARRAEGLVAEEQAALRRVATLVARGVSQDEVFAAVTEEAGWLVGAESTSLMRFEPDDTVTLVAAWSVRAASLPIGATRPVSERLRSLRTTGRPSRWGPAQLPLTGPFVEEARALGMRSFVAVPVTVDGAIWGVVFACSSADQPFAGDAEARLAGFTELVATAIANAHARAELRASVEEQAALRQVATLVAGGAPPESVFTAVVAEVGMLLQVDFTALIRYDPDDALTVVGTWTSTGGPAPTPVGRRLQLGGQNASTLVFRTGRTARIDYTDASGLIGNVATRDWGLRSSVGAPISVEGRLWGAVLVLSLSENFLAADTEARLAGFSELVATTIANAQARVELRGFAEEQAALRRVATLVARAASPEEVFTAVAAEVGRLLEVDFTILSRTESNDSQVSVGAWSSSGNAVAFPVGTRVRLGGRNVVSLVVLTSLPARIDYDADASGPIADDARGYGFRTAVGVPISVDGRLWGVMAVASGRPEPLPADTEARTAGFTELVATAIANAQARVELRGFAEEQAALRRVATLVARAAPPEEVFAAVAAEAGRLPGCDITFLNRYDHDRAATAVGAWSRTGTLPVPIGTRASLGGRNVPTLVFQTGRPARIDDYTQATGPVADVAGRWGLRSAVGAPISVEGRPWGVMSAISTRAEPLPADTEARLAGFTELVGTAIANAEAQAALTASRARIVATADTTRRRIQRDLHDGAQQRLVSLALQLRAARAAELQDVGELNAQLDNVADGLTGVLEELREIAHGIHPAILTEGGLRPALKTLARRSAVPVRLDVRVDGRLPEPIELAAYYVLCEALTNTAKHASATLVDIRVETDGNVVDVFLHDDGRGGADLTRGTGLVGLADRVAALGGRLSLHSPPGEGTTMHMILPLTAADAPRSPAASTDRDDTSRNRAAEPDPVDPVSDQKQPASAEPKTAL